MRVSSVRASSRLRPCFRRNAGRCGNVWGQSDKRACATGRGDEYQGGGTAREEVGGITQQLRCVGVELERGVTVRPRTPLPYPPPKLRLPKLAVGVIARTGVRC